jgi:hypothetical protein
MMVSAKLRMARSISSASPPGKLQRAQIGGDLARAAGEQPPLAIARLGRHLRPEALHAQGQGDAGGVAPGLGHQLAQLRDAGAVARQALHREGGVGADRVPAIAQPRGAAQRRAALAADPDRRVRLLHRLRLEADIAEADMLAREFGCRLRPERLAGHDVFVGHPTAGGEIRQLQRLELLLQPAGADAEGQAPFRQHIDGRDHLRQQHRWPVRHHRYRGDQPQRPGLGGDEGHLGQLLVPLPAGGGGEFAGVRIGVFGVDVLRDDHMVADGGVVEAHGLAFLDKAGKGAWKRHRAAGWRAEADLHGGLSSSAARIASRRALPHDAASRKRGQGLPRVSGRRNTGIWKRCRIGFWRCRWPG